MFATPGSAKCEKFISRLASENASGIDAVSEESASKLSWILSLSSSSFHRRAADIVPLPAINGGHTVNATVKVRWNKKIYTAKIVHISSKDQCEKKIGDVIGDGKLVERFFTVGGFHDIGKRIDEVNHRINRLDLRVASLEAQGNKEKERCTLTEDSIDYSLVPQDRVETLLSLKHRSMTKFALAIEQELFKDDQPELAKNVEERKVSAKKIDCMRKVVFKHFTVSNVSEPSVWQTVKNAINAKTRTNGLALA
uniref:BEN domain-containing protein n=1 Tax=Haemonchus contortus TaxID=6289 RepID=A0A7I4YM46_HAECO